MYSGRAKEANLKDVYLECENENDPELLAEIIESPQEPNTRLTSQVCAVFDPSSLLSKLNGGGKIVVCDSNADLPSNWS